MLLRLRHECMANVFVSICKMCRSFVWARYMCGSHLARTCTYSISPLPYYLPPSALVHRGPSTAHQDSVHEASGGGHSLSRCTMTPVRLAHRSSEQTAVFHRVVPSASCLPASAPPAAPPSERSSFLRPRSERALLSVHSIAKAAILKGGGKLPAGCNLC